MPRFDDPDIAGETKLSLPKAFKELAEGEKQAAAMERHLDAVEKKIEELLAQAQEDERRMQTGKVPSTKQTKDTTNAN